MISKQQNRIARQMWEFAIDNELWFSAAHIPGKQHVEAVEASRVFNDNTEWVWRDDLFESMCDFWKAHHWFICFQPK